MAANVETMFSVREVPWHGLGTIVQDAPSSVDALRLAGLDWDVISSPMFIQNGQNFIEVPNTIANVRNSDNSVLGVVTGKYKICQNKDAFDFTDALLGMNVKYETAGSLANGRRVWLLAKMPGVNILGDQIDPYLCFTNSHDGRGSITVATVPIRVVCQNTLNLALGQASRVWSTKHMGNLETKRAEAFRTLDLANRYMLRLEETANNLVGQPFDAQKFSRFIETLLPIKEDATPRQETNVLTMREDLSTRFFNAPDLENFRYTKWGALQAVTDFAFHKEPGRMTDTYQQGILTSAIDGNSIVDSAYELLVA